MPDDEPFATDTFSMDCPSCGPGTVQFLNGEMVPHGCPYEPPSLVLRCEGEPMPLTPRQQQRSRDVAASVATAIIVVLLFAVAATPVLWALITFWRWVL
jgi:hypothetical protein